MKLKQINEASYHGSYQTPKDWEPSDELQWHLENEDSDFVRWVLHYGPLFQELAGYINNDYADWEDQGPFDDDYDVELAAEEFFRKLEKTNSPLLPAAKEALRQKESMNSAIWMMDPNE